MVFQEVNKIIQFSNTSNRGRVRSLNTRQRFRLAVKTSNVATAFKKEAMITSISHHRDSDDIKIKSSSFSVV